MVTQVINTVQLPVGFEGTANTAAFKKLPVVDSLVEVAVIDKTGKGFKILVDGKLYQAELPVPALVGDTLAARVLNVNPLLLQLNNLAANLSAEQVILQLISKLNLKDSKLLREIISVLVSKDKPMSKRKIEHLLGLIENSGIDYEDIDLAGLIVLYWDDENLSDLNENNIQLFSTSVPNLTKEIFAALKKLFERLPENDSLADLKNLLCINPADGNLTGALLNRISSRSTEKLINWTVENLADENNDIKHIASLLSTYLLKKLEYMRKGIGLDFVILLNGKNSELINYQQKNISDNKGNRAFDFKLELGLEHLGSVMIDALLTDKSAAINFEAGRSSVHQLIARKEELRNILNQSFGLKSLLSFEESGNKITNKVYSNYSEGLNVQA